MRPTLFAFLFLALGSCLHDEDAGQGHFGTFTPDDLVGNWICDVVWSFPEDTEETWEIIFTKDFSGKVDLAFVINDDFYNTIDDSLDPHFLFYADGTLVISVDYERVDLLEGFVVRTYEWDLEMDAGGNGWTGTLETAFQNFDGGDWWEETNQAVVVGVKQ